VHALRGLAPAQDLALYDAFRITNVVQLAHNRIMLEARVIEYLSQHPEEGARGLQGTEAEIASILGTGAAWAAEGAPEPESEGEAALRSMTGEITEHVRERLESLRDRARERAAAIPARGVASQEELTEEAARVRQAGGGAGRMDALRESRQRIAAARGEPTVERGGASAASRAAELSARREAMASSRTTRVAGEAEAPRGTATGRTTTAAPPPPPPPPRPAPPRPSVAALRAAEAAAAEAQAEAAAAAEAEAPREAPPTRPGLNPWLLVAAAVVVALIIAVAAFLLRQPAEMEQAAAPPPAVEQGAGETGAAPGAAPGATAEAQPVPTAVREPLPPPPPPAKAIHEVQRGQSLWRISNRYYATPLKWPEIFRANQDRIQDPNLIYPEQRFRIPPD